MGETVNPSRTLRTHWRVEGRSRTDHAILKMIGIPRWVTAHSPAVGLMQMNPSLELKHGGKIEIKANKTHWIYVENSFHNMEIIILN